MAQITPWKPFNELSTFRREMDNIWRRFLGEAFTGRPVSESWMPAVDISESDGEISVKAELPGLEGKDVDVNISNNVLTIKGEKKSEEEQGDENYFSRESYAGFFQRRVQLPADVKSENAEARFKNGVLLVKLPKAETSTTKRIEIQH